MCFFWGLRDSRLSPPGLALASRYNEGSKIAGSRAARGGVPVSAWSSPPLRASRAALFYNTFRFSLASSGYCPTESRFGPV